ncbi:hypothetical protein HYR53_06705 [Candidatus Acetothermia bacterium]|nr:hypothetical protein [Candidatus Acetothermia bacterium]
MTLVKSAVPFAFLILACGLIAVAQVKPDVQVRDPIDLSPSGSVEQGTIVTISALISNGNAAPVTQSFDVIFQLEDTAAGTARTLTSSEVQCLTMASSTDASHCTIPGLAAVGQDGSSITIRAQFNTANISPSTYNIIATSKFTDENSKNDSGQAPITITQRFPNVLVLGEFALSPSSPREGDVLTVDFTIENDRLADINVPFDVSLAIRKRVGDDQFNEFTTLSPPSLSCPDCKNIRLLSGERKIIEAQVASVLIDPGDYQMRILVDPNGVIPNEVSTKDNILTFDFVLGQPLRNLSFGGVRVSPQAARPGQLFALNFTINNSSFASVQNVEISTLLRTVPQGSAAALVVPVKFTCSASSDSFVTGTDITPCTLVQRVGPEQGLDLQLQFDSTGLSFGNYEWVIKLDPNNLIQETDEDDNTLTAVVTLADQNPQAARGPELHPVSLDLAPSSPVVRGQKVVVSSTIKNSGNQDAQNFKVVFSVRREDSGQNQGYQTISTKTIEILKLGLSMDVKTTLDTSTLDPGLYSIKIEIISTDQAELDANNNSLIAFFTVVASP